ncbi:hypothetical protein FRC00_010568 [Tulasnella sp. 408]|nr:hypothetical protein FRC00_010568 [Tulasnella sp. 408]
MSALAVAVQRLWRIHLTGFLLHGILSKSDPLAEPPQTSSASDSQRDKPLNTTKSISALVLNNACIPSCVTPQTRESILYVGKAVAIVKNQGYSQKQLPKQMIFEYSEAFERVLPQDGFSFDRVVAELRTTISEFLWAHVLKEKDVEEAVESLSEYFLLRNGEFAVALIREIERLKTTKLSSRSSGIREQDLSLALLRASLGTTAQHDPSLSRIQFHLPGGPIKPFSVPRPGAMTAGMISEFSDYLLGTPLLLNYALQWPLDLFLVPSDLQIYSHLFAYFSAIRRAQHITSECWTSLSNAQRSRRRWTGPGSEGGTEDSEARARLLRCGWGVLRQMLWFLDTLWGYLMNDVVGVQYRKFKDQLKPPLPPPPVPLEPRITPRPSTPGNVKDKSTPERPKSKSTPEKPKSKGTPEKSKDKSHHQRPAVKSPSKNTTGEPESEDPPRPESVASERTRDGTILAQSHRSVHSVASTITARKLRHLDFSTLRLLHSTYLRSLLTGSLLADPTAATTIRSILDVCNEFVGQIERWGGDVLPALLSEGSLAAQDAGVGKKVKERWAIVREIDGTLNELLHSFYQHLTESMSHGSTNVPISADASVLLNASTTILGLNVFRNLGGKSGAGPARGVMGKDGEATRQLEHLLLRLDFNSALSTAQLNKVSEGDDTELLDAGET